MPRPSEKDLDSVVLDSSALLAFLREEPGAERVAAALGRGTSISAVNWSEVLTKLADLGFDLELCEKSFETSGALAAALAIVPFDAEQARLAAELRASTRASGLSLGDRACLALAVHLEASALTADREWSTLALPVEIRLVR